MNTEDKPDPDKILKAIKEDEQKTNAGQLKIFFGMSAGVGKTFAMLQAAHERLKEGVNLVIGTINTHGRVETEKLVKNLPIIPEKWVGYKNKAFTELDLEAILKLKPKLVLIDELAHTNVPGSKHLKRWQDVVEILEAGIDVYTTLNVQHLESRKDLVESISGIQIHETVPDLILEMATAIEIIDIPPSELLRRLKEGKVYLGDQSQIAAQNFFQEDRLTALREIALRFTAEKVDHDLHGILTLGKGWKTRERLMVAITHAPSSQQLIRSARRFAFELDAPWIVVYVKTDIELKAEDQSRLNKHLQLAKELGAEIVIVDDLDIVNALQQIAKQKSITRLVIGRPTERTFFQRLFKTSLLDELEMQSKQMDILIMRQDKLTSLYQKTIPKMRVKSPPLYYWTAVGVIACITLISYFFSSWLDYKTVGHLFLISILFLSLFAGQGPVLLAAALSALSWDYLFIPPAYSFIIKNISDITLLCSYFFAALIVGMLNARIRLKDHLLSHREKNIEHLYCVAEEISKSRNLESLRLNIDAKLKQLFGGEFDILSKGFNNQLILESKLPFLHEETDQAAALWCYHNGKTAGWSTDSLPSAQATYYPIKFSNITLGVLIHYSKSKRSLSFDEVNFLLKVTDRLGIYLDHALYEESNIRQNYTRQAEKLHNAIFHSLSKGFYAPLEEILCIIDKFKALVHNEDEIALAKKMEYSGKNLKIIVDNILTLSNLESGFIQFDKQKHSIKQLIEEIVVELKSYNSAPLISIAGPDIFVDCDKQLMKIALKNLLINAISYSPPSAPVQVIIERFPLEVEIAILDEGSGIPEEMTSLIFEKFYRLPGTQTERIGIGLTLVKAVIDLHGGRLQVRKRDEKGTSFSVFIPNEKINI